MKSATLLYRSTRLFLTLAVSLLFHFDAQAQAKIHIAQLKYKTIEHNFSAADKNAIVNGAPLKRDVSWSYPIFISSTPHSVEKLNEWLRATSLRILIDDDDMLPRLLAMPDQEIIQYLEEHFESMEQSEISLGFQIGNYASFTLFTTMLGNASLTHGKTELIYDVKHDKDIEVQSLFKVNALDEIKYLFWEKNDKKFPSCNRIRADFS